MASDGHSLRLYQAVIEAKKLLSELSNPEISVSLTRFSLFAFLLLSYITFGVIGYNFFLKRKRLIRLAYSFVQIT